MVYLSNMKKIILKSILFGFTFFLFSCNNNKENNSQKSNDQLTETDFKKILEKMEKDGDLDEKVLKKINSNINELKTEKEKDNKSNSEAKDTSGAIKVNSMALFMDIYNDRSLKLSKYLDKTLIVTDLILDNVKTIDYNQKYIKCADAFPFNPKTNIIGKNSLYSSVELTFNSQPIYYNEVRDMVYYGIPPVKIMFENPDEMKKVNLLEWENNEGFNYTHKIDIICKLDKENISYKAGSEAENDIKAKEIFITFKNAQIFK